MIIVDSTKVISKYLEDNCNGIKQGEARGAGGWCRKMSVVDGTEMRHTLFLRREVQTDRTISMFEIWDERTIAIPEENWDMIVSKIESTVSRFETETNQTITMKKVVGPTKWADY